MKFIYFNYVDVLLGVDYEQSFTHNNSTHFFIVLGNPWQAHNMNKQPMIMILFLLCNPELECWSTQRCFLLTVFTCKLQCLRLTLILVLIFDNSRFCIIIIIAKAYGSDYIVDCAIKHKLHVFMILQFYGACYKADS